MSMQNSHCYCLVPIVGQVEANDFWVALVSTQKFVWHVCVLCACCFRETKVFCHSLFMIDFVFVHEYHTTFIQKGDVQCVFVRYSIRQLSYREMCVLPNVHCNSRAARTQTNDASLGPTEPTSLGRGHENDVSLPVSQSPTSCPSSQLRFAKMTTGSVSVASCSDRRKKSLSQLCLQEQSVMNLFKWESR